MTECTCKVAIYGDDRRCLKCRGLVPCDGVCESCKVELEDKRKELCAACTTRYAWQAARVVKRIVAQERD